MDSAKFVICGGGMVAGYAAKQLVELGMKSGDLTILSADNAVPYERPPLSKGFLAGKETEEGIRINPEEFYRQHGIGIRLGGEVTAVDPNRKRVSLRDGGEIGFERLILATGARVRTFDLPGARLRNIRYLRSLDDSKAIRETASRVRHAAVIGGGFIGMEVASVLAQANVEVTLILSEDRIWKRFFTPEMSQAFENYFEARGVRFVKRAAVQAFRGKDAVESVEFRDGSAVPCELVVAGIGVEPVTGYLAGSGIEVGDGVMVNEYLETNVPGILAAGDLANYPDVLFGKRRRVEHWDNAVSQGQHCARNLMGERAPFRHVPYFFSDVFDLSYEFWGDPADVDRVVHRGDLAGASFSVWWLRQSRVVAAFVMRRPDEEREAAPRWIESGEHVSAAKLAEEHGPVEAAVER
ncbi:MAG TPA: FAD-dependent oxidoreductase [Bryobacteraceae bacterium]|jgi:NADPH-dependent 2,4-dienoyl-CoA reductase/sulfur reductase-like enzyme|nr:FAD-dependent oxidoreductase [Bryobacteraceae bacterium]